MTAVLCNFLLEPSEFALVAADVSAQSPRGARLALATREVTSSDTAAAIEGVDVSQPSPLVAPAPTTTLIAVVVNVRDAVGAQLDGLSLLAEASCHLSGKTPPPHSNIVSLVAPEAGLEVLLRTLARALLLIFDSWFRAEGSRAGGRRVRPALSAGGRAEGGRPPLLFGWLYL